MTRRWLPVAALFVVYLFVEAISSSGLWMLAKTRGVRYGPLPSTLSIEQRIRLAEFIA